MAETLANADAYAYVTPHPPLYKMMGYTVGGPLGQTRLGRPDRRGAGALTRYTSLRLYTALHYYTIPECTIHFFLYFTLLHTSSKTTPHT